MPNDLYRKSGDKTPFEPLVKDQTASDMAKATYDRVTKPAETAARATADAFTKISRTSNIARTNPMKGAK